MTTTKPEIWKLSNYLVERELREVIGTVNAQLFQGYEPETVLLEEYREDLGIIIRCTVASGPRPTMNHFPRPDGLGWDRTVPNTYRCVDFNDYFHVVNDIIES